MIPDSHAHLDLIDREADAVVSEARSAGVSPIITIGINIDSSLEAVRCAESLEGVYAAVGIHPNDTVDIKTGDFSKLERIASGSDRVVALGETGLDYYRDRSPGSSQKEAFREHVRLAKVLELPLIVHDREAHKDVLELLEVEKADAVPVIMHCFSGDTEMLAEVEKRGYYISFAGPLTFKKAEKARQVASLAPLDRVLVETDAPFLSPEPFRGKPNLPERARFVAGELARLHGLSFEKMEKIVSANTSRVFGIEI